MLTFTSTSILHPRVIVDSHVPAPPADASIGDIEQTNRHNEQVRQQSMVRNAARAHQQGMAR